MSMHRCGGEKREEKIKRIKKLVGSNETHTKIQIKKNTKSLFIALLQSGHERPHLFLHLVSVICSFYGLLTTESKERINVHDEPRNVHEQSCAIVAGYKVIQQHVTQIFYNSTQTVCTPKGQPQCHTHIG